MTVTSTWCRRILISYSHNGRVCKISKRHPSFVLPVASKERIKKESWSLVRPWNIHFKIAVWIPLWGGGVFGGNIIRNMQLQHAYVGESSSNMTQSWRHIKTKPNKHVIKSCFSLILIRFLVSPSLTQGLERASQPCRRGPSTARYSEVYC